jgi:hypothetical protein
MKFVLLVVMMVGGNAVSTERFYYSSLSGCEAGADVIWMQYRKYLQWSSATDDVQAPQSSADNPTKGVPVTTIPVPLTYCVVSD